MKVAIGADHKGFHYKEEVKALLEQLGHEALDFGTDSEESVDYPDFGLKVAHAVADGTADRGITICWTGNGMNITANKVPGVRAGMALNPEMAYYTRLHNDANVLTLSSRYTPEKDLKQIVETFLSTDFEGGRHQRRVEKIKQEESEHHPC
ncbi:MAG: ribose 5-phosphate isomerase B [Candidatus Zixiibacteriota bacterium]|nr:MAG: ribose 5-phosphate isomerase B [candidate division Zixibacteria bacterium]